VYPQPPKSKLALRLTGLHTLPVASLPSLLQLSRLCTAAANRPDGLAAAGLARLNHRSAVMGEGTSGQRSIDRAAVGFIVLLGFVSLFGDMTYEGARSIIGPYLATLGASATVVGIAAGFGELVGYAIRLLSGYIGDRTGRYWAVTIIGYILNLFAVPLLALAGSWEIAVAHGACIARTDARRHAVACSNPNWGGVGIRAPRSDGHDRGNCRAPRGERGAVFWAGLSGELCSCAAFDGRSALCTITVPGTRVSRGKARWTRVSITSVRALMQSNASVAS
jgi:hypothetical protein